jgi:hypothetical protein
MRVAERRLAFDQIIYEGKLYALVLIYSAVFRMEMWDRDEVISHQSSLGEVSEAEIYFFYVTQSFVMFDFFIILMLPISENIDLIKLCK